jgi:CoA:oxalate CoA-transferase
VLDGIRVLDLTQYMAGPYCTALLADMGAEVIRIEMPGGAADREQGPSYAGQNLRFWLLGRNKKGITLNIAKPEGKELFNRLIEKSDVFVNSYIIDIRQKLGLLYKDLVKVNGRLVQVDISGFGDTGPDADRPCFDHIAQAESGAMSYAGFKGNPPVRWPVSWIDISTGQMAAYGAVLALYHREKTGRGQRVEVSLFNTGVAAVSFHGHSVACEVLNEKREQLGNAGYYTFSNVFTARDGTVFLDATSDRLWKKFIRVIGHPELADDPRFKDDTLRYRNRESLIPIVQKWVEKQTADEVCQKMRNAKLPHAKIKSIADVIHNPQVEAQGLFVDVDIPGANPIPHPRLPLSMSETPPKIMSAAPAIGEHNNEVYGNILGLTEDEIHRLGQNSVI